MFSTKSDLITALRLVVCNVDSDPIKLYGAPDGWDVSAVTDMSYLIGANPRLGHNGLSCKATFNEVRTPHVKRGLVLFLRGAS